MRAPAMPWIGGRNGKKRHIMPAVAALLAFAAGTIFLWQVFWHSPVVDYGTPGNTFFKPSRGVEGSTIEICFNEIKWEQLCLSTLVTRITPAQGPALELDDYKIKVPAEIGPVKAKCRSWHVPSLGGNDERGRPIRKEGPAVVSGFVRSECTPLDRWRPIKTPMPSIPLDWIRARPS